MAVKKRALGRGLDALLGPGRSVPPVSAVQQVPAPVSEPVDGGLRTLGVEQLQRGKFQPRKDMHQDSLDELADSIRAQGIVQPIVVRPIGDNNYEIIAGERRWRAAQLAELKEVPVVVRKIDDRAAIAMSLIENIQREDLNPLEEAAALQRLIQEFEMTHQQAADAVGRSRASVSNLLRLLDLGDIATDLAQRGKLEMGHARALLALNGQLQGEAAQQVVKQGLSVRATERLVQKLQAETSSATKKPVSRRRDPNLARLEQDLADKIGAPVQIQYNDKGRGKLTIAYHSLDELDGILEHIQ
ncbi:MAG: ParB/RepB/Spo0J family partition protein [Gammaproteobacteria bacterium]